MSHPNGGQSPSGPQENGDHTQQTPRANYVGNTPPSPQQSPYANYGPQENRVYGLHQPYGGGEQPNTHSGHFPAGSSPQQFFTPPVDTPPATKTTKNSNNIVIAVVVVIVAAIVGVTAIMIAALNAGGEGTPVAAASIDASSTVDPSLDPEGSGGDIESDPGTADSNRDGGSLSGAIEKERERDKIYWNLDDYKFLQYNPEGVYPGSGYLVETADGVVMCSTGWIVSPREEPETYYMLTAGHCGEVGDKVYYDDPNAEKYIYVGDFVWKEQDSKPGGIDYGLVKLGDNFDLYSSLPVDGKLQISGWRGPEWIKAKKPYTCRIGASMGLSCGEYIDVESDYVYRYENISNSGDSGGAVWAQDPDSGLWYAVGITSFTNEADGTNAGSVTIEPVMNHFDLEILGPGPS